MEQMSEKMIETKNFEKKELHKVLRDRSDETPRILGDRLNELEGAEASVAAMKDISAAAPMTLRIGARLNIAQRRYPEARATLRRVMEEFPDSAAAKDAAARLSRMAGEGR